MKKKMLFWGLRGFPTGIAIGYLITICIPLLEGGETYSPCVPELVAVMGNELHAVALQAFLCGLLGAGFAAGLVVWEIERWSLVKQTGIYFLITSGLMLPIAYFTYWMEHSLVGFLTYFGIFLLIFAVTWVIQFVIGKRCVRKMNENLHHVKDSKDE